MSIRQTLTALRGKNIFLVGIKGTGMSALAEVLKAKGADVSGSDTEDHFYTEEVLAGLGIPVIEGFNAANLPQHTDMVIHSAAYSPVTHEELVLAGRLGIPIQTYAKALGALSGDYFSVGIAGVHGKTTTTAMTGALVKHLGLPATVIAGSAVADFGGRSTFIQGNAYLVAETCEYRRHFLSFNPAAIVLTSVEPDHLDYFKDLDDILEAFWEYGLRLPEGGTLIYCADDDGAVRAAVRILLSRPDIRPIAYGEKAEGPFSVRNIQSGGGGTTFGLDGFSGGFQLRIPGRHNVKNAAAAIAAVCLILEKEGRLSSLTDVKGLGEFKKNIEETCVNFRGAKRRSEVLGEARGVLFMDDYGHHPTAIQTTVEGIRRFYGGRRIVLDFMSHTYSRTRNLLDDFAKSLTAADAVILHKIYPSAREAAEDDGTGKTLFEKTRALLNNTQYFEEVMDAFDFCMGFLEKGDIFVTMGAGDNWKLGKALYAEFQKMGGASA